MPRTTPLVSYSACMLDSSVNMAVDTGMASIEYGNVYQSREYASTEGPLSAKL